jgi:hypothetical protein
MKIEWSDIKIDFSHIEHQKLTEDWQWLIGLSMKPLLLSSLGDMFLSDENGAVHWLDIGAGTITLVADSISDFNTKLQDTQITDEWFMFDLLAGLKSANLHLSQGTLYSYKKLPILGGEYVPENFTVMDIEVAISIAGQIHKQIKDLPDGTNIKISSIK